MGRNKPGRKTENLNKELFLQEYISEPSFSCIKKIVSTHKPTVIFNFAAVHASKSQMTSFDWLKSNLRGMLQTNINLTKNLMKVARDLDDDLKIIHCGSSLMYRPRNQLTMINENTKMQPQNLYGLSKIISRKIVRNYRDKYQINSGTAILFNHESEFRTINYLFNKIATQIDLYLKNKISHIEVADADYIGDWHAAEDTVRAIKLISEQERLSDYVIASGIPIKIKELITNYFENFLDLSSPPILSTKKNSIKSNKYLLGDISKISKLGWKTEIGLNDIIEKIRKKIPSR